MTMRQCRVCGKRKPSCEFYANRAVCRSCMSRKAGLRYTVRTRFRDGGSFVCKQCGKLRTAEQASTYAENLCRLCHASNLLLRKETAEDYLLCRSCGRILPKEDFVKYSMTKCRACASREAKLRREEKSK